MNVSALVFLACTVKGEVCAQTYEQLHTTLDLDAMYDLIEMRDVQASWNQAAMEKAQQDG